MLPAWSLDGRGVPPNTAAQQSMLGSLFMLGRGMHPNTALQENVPSALFTPSGRVFSALQPSTPDTSVLLSTPSKTADRILGECKVV